MSKMKNLARNYVYWQGIDTDIQRLCKECPECQQKLTNPPKQFHHWEFSHAPWIRLHIDFAEVKQQKFLLIVDSFTKWLEIYPMNSTATTPVIENLYEVFARYGLPKTIVSDNGPPFQSDEFAIFMKQNGIQHKFSSPYHPNFNGQVERYVKKFKNALNSDCRGSLRARIARFLLSYRRAPNISTGLSPAELMFNRRIRSRLDLLCFDLTSFIQAKPQTITRSFEVGTEVLAHIYNSTQKWTPGKITNRKGKVMYEIDIGGQNTISRHVDQL